MLRGASAPPWVMIRPKTPCKFSSLAPVGQYWPPPQCLRTTGLQPVPLVSQLFRQRSSACSVPFRSLCRAFYLRDPKFQSMILNDALTLWKPSDIFWLSSPVVHISRRRLGFGSRTFAIINHRIDRTAHISSEERFTSASMQAFDRSTQAEDCTCRRVSTSQYKRAQTRGPESLMALSSRIYIVLAVSFLALKSAFALNLQRRQAASCTQTTASAFNLVARYRNTPTSTIVVKVIDVNTVPKAGYSILSTCASCISSWSYNALENGALLPKSASNPYLHTVSYSLVEGESPSFISIQFPPPPASGYCSTDHVVDLAGAPLLGANGRTDQWSLCPNSTANRRVDVVWSPKAGHSHYRIEDCQAVDLEQV